MLWLRTFRYGQSIYNLKQISGAGVSAKEYNGLLIGIRVIVKVFKLVIRKFLSNYTHYNCTTPIRCICLFKLADHKLGHAYVNDEK